MKKSRKKYDAKFKAKVALEAIREREALNELAAKYRAPEIINLDQGRQFTCLDWKETCAEYPERRISMDGRGQAKDNIWIEDFGEP